MRLKIKIIYRIKQKYLNINPLTFAENNGHKEIVEILLKQEKTDINRRAI